MALAPVLLDKQYQRDYLHLSRCAAPLEITNINLTHLASSPNFRERNREVTPQRYFKISCLIEAEHLPVVGGFIIYVAAEEK